MKCLCGHSEHAHIDIGCMTRLKSTSGQRLGPCGCPRFTPKQKQPKAADYRAALERYAQHDDDCATTRRRTAPCTCGLSRLIAS